MFLPALSIAPRRSTEFVSGDMKKDYVNIPWKLALSFSLFSAMATPAMATAPVPSPDIAITTPATGDEVVSPFTVAAAATTCLSQPIASMGYSLDSDPDTVVYGLVLLVPIEANPGLHTVHVKAWGDKGAECETDLGVAVTPSTAISVSGIQRLPNWSAWQRSDPVVGGTSTGTMSLVNYGFTRKFFTTYANSGAQLYFVAIGSDVVSKNFIYDAWVSFSTPSSGIGNLQMDMNQVMTNGQTVIYGFQCDGYTETWDYTTNGGTPEKPVDSWSHSAAYCNPRDWGTDTWHHVQVSYSRDDSGNVTYNAVALDGLVSQFDAAPVPSAFALGWSPALLTNFELDGLGTVGSSTVYLNDLTVYRW
jgi:hypothetical protein